MYGFLRMHVHENFYNKNHKNPAVVAEAVGLSLLFRLFVPESKLSHNSLNIHGDVPSLSRHCGKNTRILFAFKRIVKRILRDPLP